MLKSKKRVIIFLVFIFMMPGVCAYWFYQHPNWLMGQATNKGQLLTPPVLVEALPKTAKWSLVVWNPGRCGRLCQQQLNKITRIRLALGRRFYDVNLWLLTNDKATLRLETTANLLHQQGIRPLFLSTKNRAKLPILGKKSQVFMVSPDNYLVLSYQLATNPADIYSDLQRVMNLQRSL